MPCRRFTSRRRCLLEPLETRRLLAGWQNPILPLDASDDGQVTALDALIVINELSRRHDQGVPHELSPREHSPGDPYYDVNGDGRLTAHDALLVINGLQRHPSSLALVASLAPEADPNGNGFLSQPSAIFRGQTSPGVVVELANVRLDAQGLATSDAAPIETIADADGRFTAELELFAGRNRLTFVVADELGRTKSINREVVVGDAVTDWNAAILNVVRDWTTTSDDPYSGRIVASAPPEVARNLAMIHTGMFDAINGVDPKYSPYHFTDQTSSEASPLAAGASAAFEVAKALYPEPQEVAVWEATLAESLSLVPETPAKQAGIDFGKNVAASILNLRDGDGAGDVQLYQPSPEPGSWNRTAPNYLPPLLPHWGAVQPFAVDSIIDYRPPAPPELSSSDYATAVDEVMKLGRLSGSVRTPEQTEIALFWGDGAGTATPPGHWNRIATEVTLDRGQSLLENARTFALLNLALTDAGIASWDAKYAYEFWRPLDAIRRAAEDGNPATSPDETWLPLIITPHFPAYTSGHSSFSGAGAAVLTALFGDDVAFASRSDGHTGLTQRPLAETQVRQFTSFDHAAKEAGLSRIYGGIHFMFDSTTGLDAGEAIGNDVASQWLEPLGVG